MYVCVNVCRDVGMDMCIYVYVCVYKIECVYVCMNVQVYVCVSVRVHIL